MTTNRWLKIIAGPLMAGTAYVMLSRVQPVESVARMGGIAAWMAVWWIFESVPIAVTSLLPVFLYPFTGIMSTREVAPHYMNEVLMLFIGGFLVAFAMERWGLHRRVALGIIYFIGNEPQKILLGLMLATYVLSMWVSNTATTLMMLPTALAVIYRMEEITGLRDNPFGVATMLGIAYAASIGGMATLVGTPPNMIFLSQYATAFPDLPAVSFLQWSLFALPMSAGFLLCCYFLLVTFYLRRFKLPDTVLKTVFQTEYEKLGSMTFEEKTIALLFVAMSVLWFTRADLQLGAISISGWNSLLAPGKDLFQDGTVAIFVACLLFIIPSKSRKGEMLLNWETAKHLPFGIILLFGGGFALAHGFSVSGLAEWLGQQMAGIGRMPHWLIILMVCFFMTYLSEVASNVAITQLMLPVLISVSAATGIPPLLLMIPATLAASMGFMLPVATAPNTIVFTGNKLQAKDMVKAGFWLDIIGVCWLTASMYFFGKWIFNF
ncbi:MAG: SLC13 family permease [Chitinophagales bacterium]|nr:MAG: SLC13 family permease [Chitinophagales bacterium]